MKPFTEKVREHRGQLGLSQQELADKAGIGVRTVSYTHLHTKDVLYDLSCVCIHNQLIPVIFILQIAIAGERPDKFAFFPFDSQMASDLYG